MDQRLQQAIDAARAGKNQEAQRLLTQLLKDDPEQVQAWFLLSHLVESQEKQKAYLGKVLALDPSHEQARQRLVYLHEAETAVIAKPAPQQVMAVAADSLDLLGQSEGTTLPSWMVEDGGMEATTVSVAVPQMAAAPTPTPDEEIPDWLKQPVSSAVTDTVEELEEVEPISKAVAIEKPAISPKPLPQSQEKPASQTTRWNLILVILVIVALIVAYFLIQAFLSL
ncbi:MAG: hypothetical protein KC413_07125 [Anaerolineales bacterium]|nr:hypothetical protein [Anaerolineales bacterium]MCA9975503.1 hypothetical protein [Anaerolineales bacterium]